MGEKTTTRKRSILYKVSDKMKEQRRLTKTEKNYSTGTAEMAESTRLEKAKTILEGRGNQMPERLCLSLARRDDCC